MNRRLVLLPFLAAALFALAACGGDDDDSASQPPTSASSATATAGGKDSGTPLQTPDVTAVFAGLPDGFPDDLPVFEGATILRGVRDGNGYSAEWRSDAPATDVVSFYIAALDTEPFSTTNLINDTPTVAVIDFETNDYSGKLGVGELAGGTARILVNLETGE